MSAYVICPIMLPEKQDLQVLVLPSCCGMKNTSSGRHLAHRHAEEWKAYAPPNSVTISSDIYSPWGLSTA